MGKFKQALSKIPQLLQALYLMTVLEVDTHAARATIRQRFCLTSRYSYNFHQDNIHQPLHESYCDVQEEEQSIRVIVEISIAR